MQFMYRYTDAEVKELLKTITIICDSREQANTHILDYFTKKKIPFIEKALSFGNYSYLLPAAEKYGILKDVSFHNSITIERKASLEELSSNLSQQRQRFEDEFLRSKGCNITLLVENGSYSDILNHQYRTDFKESSYMATLMAWQQRYNIRISFIDSEHTGQYIYSIFYYHLRELLKS